LTTSTKPNSSQSDQAYDEIRRRILILEIRPEQRLKEEEWASKLNVGRLAVREALTRLYGESFVTRGEKGGFFAAAMTPEDVHEIRGLREILEVGALRLAAGKITRFQIHELEVACDDFAYMVKKGYGTGACEADRSFHRLLIAASGNKKLVHAYDHCHIPLFHIIMGQSREYMDDFADTEREHREIVAAIKGGDFENAVDLLRRHFSRGEETALGKSP
jgi:DNA-binding GntR family transcriptional regulator